MTSGELRQLAEIERRLVEESPELRRLFDGAAAALRRRRRRPWMWAGAATLLLAVGLLATGVALGLPGLAVAALCPPAAFGVVLLGSLLLARSTSGFPRRRSR